MKYLRNHIVKICDWTFNRLNLFFSGERYTAIMEPAEMTYAEDGSFSNSISEWNLNQDYSDIVLKDIHSIIVKITPGRILNLGLKFYRHCYISLMEEDCYSIKVSQDQLYNCNQFNKKFSLFLSESRSFKAVNTCYSLFSHRLKQLIEKIDSLFVKIIFHNDLTTRVEPLNQWNNRIISSLDTWHPLHGPFKLILRYIFHKRF